MESNQTVIQSRNSETFHLRFGRCGKKKFPSQTDPPQVVLIACPQRRRTDVGVFAFSSSTPIPAHFFSAGRQRAKADDGFTGYANNE